MEPKRLVRKRLRKLVSHLLVLAIAAIALFDAWQSFCAIPTKESFSRELSRSVDLGLYSEAELLGLVHSEMSKKLAWLGSVDVVSANFTSRCQRDSCHVRDAILHTRITFHPLCACKNRGARQVATVYYKDYAGFYIDLSRVRTAAAEPRWNQDKISDIASVKELALRSIEDGIWDLHPELKVQIVRDRRGWSFYIRNLLDSNEYYGTGRLSDSDIQRIKEEKQ